MFFSARTARARCLLPTRTSLVAEQWTKVPGCMCIVRSVLGRERGYPESRDTPRSVHSVQDIAAMRGSSPVIVHRLLLSCDAISLLCRLGSLLCRSLVKHTTLSSRSLSLPRRSLRAQGIERTSLTIFCSHCPRGRSRARGIHIEFVVRRPRGIVATSEGVFRRQNSSTRKRASEARRGLGFRSRTRIGVGWRPSSRCLPVPKV